MVTKEDVDKANAAAYAAYAEYKAAAGRGTAESPAATVAWVAAYAKANVATEKAWKKYLKLWREYNNGKGQ